MTLYYHLVNALPPYYVVSFSPCVAGEVTAFAAATPEAKGHLILVP